MKPLSSSASMPPASLHKGSIGNIASRLMIITILTLSLITTQAPAIAQSSSGSLVIAVSGDVTGHDPAINVGSVSYLIASQVFDTLTTMPSGSKIPQPGLASSWSVSADGLTWTFNLRSGVTFHNGEAFNGSAVVTNFQRWWDTDNPYHAGNFDYFDFIFGYKDNPNTLIAGVNSPNSSQVVFHLTRKNNLLPLYLSMPPFSIASPQTIMAGSLNQHPIGTGPFRFVEWVPGNRTLLEANPAYWGQVPYLSSLTVKVLPSAAQRISAIQNNTVQAAYDMLASDYYTAYQNLNLSVYEGYAQSTGYLGINRAQGPLGDLKVRQAIAHAINKANLLQTFYDPLDILAGQFLPSEFMGYDASLTDYAYNPTQAKSLLAQAGYPNGFSITLKYRNVNRIYLRQPGPTAHAIAADLAAVGITVQVMEVESTAFINQVYAGDAELFLLGWGIDYPHPSNFFTIFCDINLYKPFGPFDTTLCDTVNNANNADNPTEQEALYKTASNIVHDSLPIVPLSHGRNTIIVRSEVAGMLPAYYTEDYENVFLTGGPNQAIDPGSETALQTHGFEAPITTIDVPANAVSEPLTLAYSLSENTTNLPPAGKTALGSPFTLTVYKNAEAVPEKPFNQPVGMTFNLATYGGYFYDPDSMELYISAPITGDLAGEETTLLSTAWVKASTTCPTAPATVVDPQKHTFTAYTCKTGQFAVFGIKDRLPVFLPLLTR